MSHGRVLNYMPDQGTRVAGQHLPSWIRQIARQVRQTAVETRLNWLANPDLAEIYHETGPFQLLQNRSIPSVITIYDLSLITHKHCHPQDRVHHFERHFFNRLRHIDHIITISDFVRDEIIDILQVPADQVTAIPLAASSNFFRRSSTEIDGYLQRRQIPKKYVLFVGTHEPRKNLVGLAKAMTQVSSDIVLVCAGWSGWLNKEFKEAITKMRLKDRIMLLGHVSDEELARLYGGARALVYPSLYEGFGLPILEAMACGCPVICSDRSSMPEVAGNAAIQISPNDPVAIADAISRVVDDDTLRQRLIKAGYLRCKDFNWKSTAERTVEVFAEVCH